MIKIKTAFKHKESLINLQTRNIIVLIRFAMSKLFRTSYNVQKTKNIFAKLFSVGIQYKNRISVIHGIINF